MNARVLVPRNTPFWARAQRVLGRRISKVLRCRASREFGQLQVFGQFGRNFSSPAPFAASPDMEESRKSDRGGCTLGCTDLPNCARTSPPYPNNPPLIRLKMHGPTSEQLPPEPEVGGSNPLRRAICVPNEPAGRAIFHVAIQRPPPCVPSSSRR